MLHRLQRPLLVDKTHLLLLQRGLFLRDHRFQPHLLVRFGVGLLVELPVGQVKPFQGCLRQLDAQLPVFLLYLVVLFRLFRLVLEAFQLVIDLEQEILYPRQVLLRSIQLLPGLFLPRLIDGNPRGLLQHPATAIVLVLDDIIHHPQLDNGIAVRAHPRIHEQVLDILQPAGDIIEPVFALPAFIELSRDCHRAEFRRQEILRILKGQAHLGKTGGAAGSAAVKDKAFKIF